MDQIDYPFKAAVIQFNPELNKRDENVKALLGVVTEAARNGAKLIVTPEMATTGYQYQNRDEISQFVDTIPGTTTNLFETVAKKYDTHIVIGMPELDYESDLYYNSAALVGPEGYIGKYRKMHQWVSEAYWSCWGDIELPVFDTKIGKIAIMICQDAVYPETARLASVKGADILAFPTNSSGQSITLLQAWAEVNGLYVVGANRTNTEDGFHMVGGSAIWSPEGNKLIEAPYIKDSINDINEPTIYYAEIDPTKYRNQAKLRLQERKPELYKELMLFLGPWDNSKNTKSYDVIASALQYEPITGDKEINFYKVKSLVHKAVQKCVDNNKKLQLIVLPELSITGPVNDLDKDSIFSLAETMDGPTVNKMKKLAFNYDLYIVFGLVEKVDNSLYNTAVLLSPEGGILGKYQKVHLNSSDQRWAIPGDRFSVFPTKNIGRIGLMIGYDAAFPEVSSIMAIKRADIIVIPSNWRGEFGKEIQTNKDIFINKYPSGSITTWDVIAKGAQAYTIVANFIGTDQRYKGRSSLYTLDPYYGLDQPVVATETEEEALIFNFSTLQTEWWLNQEKLILTRRTFLYKSLVI